MTKKFKILNDTQRFGPSSNFVKEGSEVVCVHVYVAGCMRMCECVCSCVCICVCVCVCVSARVSV